MERACVLLKDVLDHSLHEIAELTGSTLGGVKAALHRGRAKLAPTSPAHPAESRATAPDVAELLARWVERFNRRDWDGLRELVSADTRVRVGDRFAGRFADSPYFGRYDRMATPWRLRLADVDGERMILSEYRIDGVWTAAGIIRLTLRDGCVAEIADYHHCPWMLGAASDVRLL
jgi:RNA polymerase sigma-70 factor (ECF subfamily)